MPNLIRWKEQMNMPAYNAGEIDEEKIAPAEVARTGHPAERKKEIDTSTSRDEEISKEGDDYDKHIAKMHNAGGAETL